MRNFLVTVLKVALFVAVFVLLNYAAATALPLIPGASGLSGGAGALVSQLAILLALLVANILFGYIDPDAKGNGPISFGWPRIGTCVTCAFLAAVLPVIVLVASGTCGFTDSGVVSNEGIVTGLGAAIQQGVAEGKLIVEEMTTLGYGWWVAYLLALAATESLACFGYIFAVTQARMGDIAAVLISTVVFLGMSSTYMPRSLYGVALVTVVGLTMALIALESGGFIAPMLMRFAYLFCARFLFGVVLVSQACPSVFPLAIVGEGTLFGIVEVPQNITLNFLVCACIALALCALRAWRTRPR